MDTMKFSASLSITLNITYLKQHYKKNQNSNYDHVFYSGPLDAYFNFELGRLGYRTLDFEKYHAVGALSSCAVINYCEADVPCPRIFEHKHFGQSELHEKTVYVREYSRYCEMAMYRITLSGSQMMKFCLKDTRQKQILK